jgi:hypothetical protein
MKSHLKFAMLGLGVFAAAVGVTESKAQPTNLIYKFNSPSFHIEAGLQVGSNNKIHATQFSSSNVFAVTQIGKNNVAHVRQFGNNNVAYQYQYGARGSEFVFQYGLHNSDTMIQIGNANLILPIQP